MHGADDAGGVFRPQRDLLAAAIGEGVHLLGDDIGRLADRPREHLGELEDRRRDLLIAVTLGEPPRRVDDGAMPPLLVGQEILGAAHRLQGRPSDDTLKARRLGGGRVGRRAGALGRLDLGGLLLDQLDEVIDDVCVLEAMIGDAG